MDIGKIGVGFGLFAAVAAVVLYLISLRGSRKMLVAARFSFGLAAVSGLFCFGWLPGPASTHRPASDLALACIVVHNREPVLALDVCRSIECDKDINVTARS